MKIAFGPDLLHAPAPGTQVLADYHLDVTADGADFVLTPPTGDYLIVYFGYIARMARAGTIEVLESDYTRTATMKGLTTAQVMRRHVLRNALVPLITVLGPNRSINRPFNGLRIPATTKPKEKAPAVTPRLQPNSFKIGGNSRENPVRAFTPMPMVTKVTATMIQP